MSRAINVRSTGIEKAVALFVGSLEVNACNVYSSSLVAQKAIRGGLLACVEDRCSLLGLILKNAPQDTQPKPASVLRIC